MNDSDLKKGCCIIISESDFMNEEKYINFLEAKFEDFILAGFNYFVAYDSPFFYFKAFQILDDIRKKRGVKVYIEYVIVNANTKRYTRKKRLAQYETIRSTIDFTTHLNEEYNYQNVKRLCEYLTGKSDLLFCIDDQYKLRHGNTTSKIYKAFKHCNIDVNFTDNTILK